jgi:hypothetical protein
MKERQAIRAKQAILERLAELAKAGGDAGRHESREYLAR